MRTVDVMLAFPPLLFLLVLITGAGTGVGVLVIGVAAIQAPGISRIVRTATLEVSVRGYVEAAVARGERAVAVVVREVLPNILAPGAGRRRPALHLLDPDHRLGQLPRPRAAAAQLRLGAHDQREPRSTSR